MQLLKAAKVVETHLVISASAARTIKEETRHTLAEVRALADHCHDQRDIGAAIASGSFLTSGLLVAPCSVRTLSCIAHGNSGELIARTADVCLKERRRVVLLFRETPLHAGHIEIMSLATRSGAVIMPPVPAFYFRPETIEEIVDQTIGRALDLFDIEIGVVHRWRDPPS
jgi:4-hydroxy-3-polyprenylbenzoate decarboxylase